MYFDRIKARVCQRVGWWLGRRELATETYPARLTVADQERIAQSSVCRAKVHMQTIPLAATLDRRPPIRDANYPGRIIARSQPIAAALLIILDAQCIVPSPQLNMIRVTWVRDIDLVASIVGAEQVNFVAEIADRAIKANEHHRRSSKTGDRSTGDVADASGA